MKTIELYSCEELWELMKQKLFSYVQESNHGGYIITDHIDNKELFSFVLSNKQKQQKLIISYNEFENIYNQLNTYKVDKETILYSNNYLEIPLNLINIHECIDNKTIWPVKISDNINQIDYELYYASEFYNMYIINQLKKVYNQSKLELYELYIFHPIYNFFISHLFDEDITKKIIFNNINNCFTLKISTRNNKNLDELYKLSEAIIFNLMLNYNLKCEHYMTAYDLLYTSENLKKKKVIFILNKCITPPQRIYKDHIIDYYRLAFSSNEPFSQYLSYYHILECFFDEVFNQHLREQFKNKITAPQFSYKNNNELDNVIDFIKKETKNCKKNGQGNELDSLKLVLDKYVYEYISVKEFQDKLTGSQAEYYCKHKISFTSQATNTPFQDKNNFSKNLAKRIYHIRNALVHSKEDRERKRYKPYENHEELQKEIPLIKLIAELVIINSSTPL